MSEVEQRAEGLNNAVYCRRFACCHSTASPGSELQQALLDELGSGSLGGLLLLLARALLLQLARLQHFEHALEGELPDCDERSDGFRVVV